MGAGRALCRPMWGQVMAPSTMLAPGLGRPQGLTSLSPSKRCPLTCRPRAAWLDRNKCERSTHQLWAEAAMTSRDTARRSTLATHYLLQQRQGCLFQLSLCPAGPASQSCCPGSLPGLGARSRLRPGSAGPHQTQWDSAAHCSSSRNPGLAVSAARLRGQEEVSVHSPQYFRGDGGHT